MIPTPFPLCDASICRSTDKIKTCRSILLLIILNQNKQLPPNYNVVSNKVFTHSLGLKLWYISVLRVSINLKNTIKGCAWFDNSMNKNITLYLAYIDFTFDHICQRHDCKNFVIYKKSELLSMTHYIWVKYWTHYKTSFFWAKIRYF